MSHSYAWPPERTSAAAPAPGAQDAARADLAAALTLSALPQAFDLAVTGLAAAFVFPVAVFGALAPAAALAAGLAVWALAYAVAAPIARWRPAAGWQGKAIARGLLTAATVAISLIPLTGHIGWGAAAGLVAARLVQGLAIGQLGLGLPAGADAAQRAVARQSWGLALAAGAVLAALLAAGLGLGLGRVDLLAWGWRYPFFIALALNLAAFAADLAVLRMAAGAPPARPRQGPRLATIDGVRVA